MLKKQKLKKVIAIFILFVILISELNVGSIYGKTNKVYDTGAKTGTIDVDKATSESTVLNAIAHFLYAITGFIENIVSKLISIFTGEEVFPWADRVIFNTMPFLDINFLSPEEGSLFLGKAASSGSSTDTAFGNIIRNIYYTIFNLSVIFFGVVVGIMAIKLAISSIASEKAKYKQALQNWLFALILLFTSHYLIAFIFFVNEKLVETASAVLLDQASDIKVEFDADNFTDEQCKNMVKSLVSYSEKGGTISKKSANGKVTIKVFFNIGGVCFVAEDGKISDTDWTTIQNQNLIVTDPTTYENAVSKIDKDLNYKYYRMVCYLLTNKAYMKYRNGLDTQDLEKINFSSLKANLKDIFGNVSNKKIITSILNDAAYMCAEVVANDGSLDEEKFIRGLTGLSPSEYSSLVENIKSQASDNDNWAQKAMDRSALTSLSERQKSALAVASVYEDKISNTQSASEKKDVFTGMSNFFKEQIYTYKTDKNGNILSETEFSPIPAILYAIFVIQSIMYFITYLKRFFYIIILVMFAPIIILYDFLTKTTMS